MEIDGQSDTHSGSVTGETGHGMMVITSEADSVDRNEELIGAMGGINENVSAGIDENISAEIDENVCWVSLWCGVEGRRPTDQIQ